MSSQKSMMSLNQSKEIYKVQLKNKKAKIFSHSLIMEPGRHAAYWFPSLYHILRCSLKAEATRLHFLLAILILVCFSSVSCYKSNPQTYSFT